MNKSPFATICYKSMKSTNAYTCMYTLKQERPSFLIENVLPIADQVQNLKNSPGWLY